MKTLLLDIETAPNTVHVWGLYKPTVGINQIQASGYTLCWAAKWLGRARKYFNSVENSSPREMLTEIHGLLEQADAVVHFNGSRFDIPTLNREFLLHGFLPPAPFAQIDLLHVVRKQFRFVSNKLDYVSQALGLGSKVKHKGHSLWTSVMAGNPAAWKIMREYNMRDVEMLETLYYRLLPWVSAHPNMGLYTENALTVCPNCGGMNLESRGKAYTKLGSYRRFRCTDCGTWSKGRKRETGVELRQVT